MPRIAFAPFNAAGLLTSLFSLLTPSAAGAAPNGEDSFLDDLPVVLSATRLTQAPADAPGSVTVLDRDMIRASGARNISELFRLVPGFQVAMQTGNTPQVTYHGLSDEAPRRMLVQVDGRSVYSAYFISGVEWNQIGVDLDDIERIEVFRGSNSAAYGSNAFLGVANIITRPAAETQGVALRLRGGSDGVNDQGVRIGQRLGDVDLRVTAARSHDNGFADLNDWRRNELANLRADWHIQHDHQVEFQAGWTRNEFGTGKANNLSDPERSAELSTGFGLLRWRHTPQPDEELSVTYYHQQETGKDAYPYTVIVPPHLTGLPVNLQIPFFFEYGYNVTRDDLEAQRITSLSPTLRAVYGGGLRSDRSHAPLRFNTADTVRSDTRHLFGTLEWRASPAWLFNLGAMLENSSLTGTSLDPRISANYHFSDISTWRASINRSHRHPSAFEQKANMVFRNSAAFPTPIGAVPAGTVISQTFRPSPDITAERITTYEIGYLAELRSLATTIDARAFVERARNLIEMNIENSTIGLVPRDNVRYFANTGEADIRGVELSGTWRPAAQTWVNLTHTELRIAGPTVTAAQAARQSTPYVSNTAPKHTSTVFAAWEFVPRWQVSASKRWVGSMSWYQDDPHAIPMYRQLDVRIAHRFQTAYGRGEVALVGQNIDGGEQTFTSTAGVWGSRTFATLSLEL